MKFAVKFWIIGCVIIGLTHGRSLEKCPNDPPASASLLALQAAMWPVWIAALFTAPKDLKAKCEVNNG